MVIVLTYVNGQLTILSEPNSDGEHPAKEDMPIQLASSGLYQSCVMFFREQHFCGRW